MGTSREQPISVGGSAFTYFVLTDLSLPRALESFDLRVSFHLMFLAYAAVHSLAPEQETVAFEGTAHEGNDLRFGQAELGLDGFEGGTVLPGHFNDAVRFDVR